MAGLEFTIPDETLAWLNAIPQRPLTRNTRGPSRSSTYHESDSKYALTVHHNRRYSLATPPVLPPRISEHEEDVIEEEGDRVHRTPTSLMDLPNEVLDTIIAYAIAPSSQHPTQDAITISRKPSEDACTASDIASGKVVHKWHVRNYPSNLFLVNHTISAIAFHRLWSDLPVNVSLTASDSLCFLKYALSDRQRAAMRRVRFPKFILSWADPVGQDVWLKETAREHRPTPGFVQDVERTRAEAADEVAVPVETRMQSLVGLLQTRSLPALGFVAS